MNRLMKLNFCWMLLVCLLANANTLCARQFPYTAYVTGEQAYVRSGPGQRYYPTGQIPQGFAVEVYRHDNNGWCAIRPPSGSFSWVPSHQVRPSGAGVVEVIGDRVVTRVGSRLSLNRSAVQVLLPKGEQIEVIPATESDDPRWTRVAAPAGEFRWVAASGISLQPPLEATPPTPSTESGWSRQSEHTRVASQSKPNAFKHLSHQTAVSQSGLQFDTPTNNTVGEQTSLITPIDPMSFDPHAVEIIVGSPAELQLAQYQSQAAESTQILASSAAPPSLLVDRSTSLPAVSTPQVSQPRVRFRGLTTALPASVGSVEELELRLSQTVVQPPQQWELASLETAATDLLAATKSPSVRAQLREVQERIARFQQVQHRYNNPTPPVVRERKASVSALSVSSGNPPSISTQKPTFTGQTSEVRQRIKHDLKDAADPFETNPNATEDKPLYAATGLLKPVVSKREHAPQYALVDERGKVVSFVTPTPDLNLKPYIGRQIGVHGTRGFMAEYRRAHVTAGRVTTIDAPIRR